MAWWHWRILLQKFNWIIADCLELSDCCWFQYHGTAWRVLCNVLCEPPALQTSHPLPGHWSLRVCRLLSSSRSSPSPDLPIPWFTTSDSKQKSSDEIPKYLIVKAVSQVQRLDSIVCKPSHDQWSPMFYRNKENLVFSEPIHHHKLEQYRAVQCVMYDVFF